jgi:acyl carrier protein
LTVPMAIPQGDQFPVVSDLAVREFILRQFPRARKQQINNSDHLLESGTLDSLGILQVVTFIEQEYGFTVSDEDLVPENFQTIDRISAYIDSKKSSKLWRSA